MMMMMMTVVEMRGWMHKHEGTYRSAFWRSVSIWAHVQLCLGCVLCNCVVCGVCVEEKRSFFGDDLLLPRA